MALLTRGPHAISKARNIARKATSWDVFGIGKKVTRAVRKKFPHESARDIKTLVASVIGTITCSFKASEFEPDRYVFLEAGLAANLERVQARRRQELARLQQKAKSAGAGASPAVAHPTTSKPKTKPKSKSKTKSKSKSKSKARK